MSFIRNFIEELGCLGYVEGKNLVLEFYSGQGNRQRYSELAREVARLAPDLIVTVSGSMVQHFQLATATIPIVGMMTDPIAFDIAANLARPGGNITKISVDAGVEIWGKRLALLKEAIPMLSRAGYLTARPTWEGPDAAAAREAAQRMGISLVGVLLEANIEETEYRRALAAIPHQRLGGLLVGDSLENFTYGQVIVEVAEKDHLAVIYPWRELVEIGGLMAYSYYLPDIFRQAAHQVDGILKGNKPSEMLSHPSTSFELVINAKAAEAIDVTIPPSLLLRADEVIE